MKFFKYCCLIFLGLKIEELDFGDVFLTKNENGEKLPQKRFLHIAGKWEIKRALKKAGFKIEAYEKMEKLSLKDVAEHRGSLSKTFDFCKKPIFYICKK